MPPRHPLPSPATYTSFATTDLQVEVAGFIWLPVDPGVAVAAYIEEKHAIATAIASENAQKARRLAESHVMG